MNLGDIKGRLKRFRLKTKQHIGFRAAVIKDLGTVESAPAPNGFEIRFGGRIVAGQDTGMFGIENDRDGSSRA